MNYDSHPIMAQNLWTPFQIIFKPKVLNWVFGHLDRGIAARRHLS
jgi:hypothetical protein